MLTKLKSLSLIGLDGQEIEVEVDLHGGLPKFSIVGLGDIAVQESKERVKSAIKNSGFSFPNKQVVVNLAPADLKKHGPKFDLPIALGILQATGQIVLPENLENSIFVGELGFSGKLRSITGVLPITSFAKDNKFREIYIPFDNAEEASFIDGIKIIPVKNLREMVDYFEEKAVIKGFIKNWDLENLLENHKTEEDMKHIRGNEQGKRALEISAAGGHNILMSGPPGSGKSMLAKSLSTILPKISIEDALEVTKIHSIAGLINEKTPIALTRPFRTIHHTASGVSIVGGGNPPKPGEISLAHRGVLFLDELPEFPQKTLEVLRQPLEDGVITVSRAGGSYKFPARVILIAAMNPTPCGYHQDDNRCTSTPFEIQRYQNKISGPLLDRIDLHIQVPHIPFEKLSQMEAGESSCKIRQRVENSREIQRQRFKNKNIKTNAEMSSAMVKKYCVLGEDSNNLLKTATEKMELSGRAFYRILKIARTIADLEETENILLKHIAEAIQYRENK